MQVKEHWKKLNGAKAAFTRVEMILERDQKTSDHTKPNLPSFDYQYFQI